MTTPADTPLMATDDTAALVDRRALLKAEIAARTKDVDAVEAELLKCGPGDYRGTGEARAQVISPAPSVQVPKDREKAKAAIAAIRETIGDEESFKKLFWFVGGYVLTKDFRTKAGVLLTPARLQKVLAVLETPGKPYVK